MEVLTTTLGGIVIALVSGMIGKHSGEKDKVDKNNCVDHRLACTSLIGEKLNNIETKVDTLTKTVNNKLFGI